MDRYDPDHDVRFSKLKTGGYRFADAWIDPSVPLSGYKEHPTLSVEDSYKKQIAYQRGALQWKRREKKRFDDEDDVY